MRFFFFVAAMQVFVAGGAERPGKWQILGPGGGGAQYNPTVSPHDPRTVVVNCDMTGAYITHDGGGTWRMFNLGSTVRFFVFDAVDRNTIYAKTSVLWRSTDGGRTWRLAYPPAEEVRGVTMADDHAVQRVLTRTPMGNILAMAADPSKAGVLYAAMQTGGGAVLQVSRDRGATWSGSDPLPGDARRVYVDPASPENDRTVYVLGGEGVAVRERGAWRRGPKPEGAGRLEDVALGFAEGGKAVVYAVTSRDIYVSEDGGQSWKQRQFPGSQRNLRAVGTSLKHGGTAYVSYRIELDGAQYLGVAKTGDRGETWELVWKDGREKAGENVKDAWVSERFGPFWGSNPFALGVAPGNPDICYGTDFGRTMQTLDGGRTWKGVYSVREPGGGWRSTGLDVTTTYGVHFDPFDAKRVFITYTDIGLFGSEDGGRTWTSATVGVPRRWVNTTYWIEFDPKVKGRVWGVMSNIHDLPRPKMWRSQAVSRYGGGAAISEDGGRTWRVSNEGMGETAATHILMDPESPVERRVLYVAGFGRGVFKSVDGGKSWALKNAGIEGAEPFAWRLARDGRGTLYLVVARRSDDGSIGNERDGALYRSVDGAEHWTKMALPEGVNGPNGLAIDPENPERMYLAAWGRRTDAGAVGGGVYLTTDGGRTWRRVLDRDQHVYDVTIDGRDPRVLYACGFESSAWRSEDRGATWRRIRGYNFKWGHRVIPDPRRAGMIYVTTFGGSVWHGPAAGDGKAVEDIVTPALGYGR